MVRVPVLECIALHCLHVVHTSLSIGRNLRGGTHVPLLLASKQHAFMGGWGQNILYETKDHNITDTSSRFLNTQSNMTSCPPGMSVTSYLPTTTEVLCTLCKIGKYSPKESNDCISCPPGTYQNQEGKEQCILAVSNCTTTQVGASSAEIATDRCNTTEGKNWWFLIMVLALVIAVAVIVTGCFLCCAPG